MTTRCAPLPCPTWAWLAALWIGLALARGSAAADAWPAGYVVAEDTTSPDGRFGILVPAAGEPYSEPANYLAEIKEKRLLGIIEGFDYFQRRNHASLRATWAAGSKWCVAQLGGRFGYASIMILEPTGSEFAQVEVGEYIQKALNAAIVRQSRNREDGADANAHFRLGPGRVLRVRATSSTNPKRLEDTRTFCAAFAGVFDLKTKRWLASGARPLGLKDFDATDNAYANFGDEDFVVLPEGTERAEDFRGEVFRSEEQRFEKLDAILNDVYRIVRLALPPARFAAVKAEQIAWLKRREALPSAPEKARLTMDRIKTLQDLLW